MRKPIPHTFAAAALALLALLPLIATGNVVNTLIIGQGVACDHPAADRINRCPNRSVRVVMLDHRLVDTHR